MTKVREIVNGALSRLRNTDSTEEPTPEDSKLALDTFNRMLSGLKAEGLDVDHTTYADVNKDVTLDPMHDDGLIAMLAVKLGDDLGKPVTNQLRRDAIAGRNGIVSQYWLQNPMRVDPALANMPSQRLWTY